MSKHSHAAILSIFGGIVTEHIAALRDALAKLAAPSPSDEDLHQFRVTLRRLRSAWVTFAPVLPASFVAKWKPRLRALAASTGPVREWDVLLTDWLPAVQASLLDSDKAGRAWLDEAFEKSQEVRNRAWGNCVPGWPRRTCRKCCSNWSRQSLPFMRTASLGGIPALLAPGPERSERS